MEHTPKISVIMSVYNGEAYLEEAIESVLSQTFSDFELIVIDDHSSDATPEILSRLAEKDARLRAVRNEENLRLPASLNRGISMARGAFIARMDADDICVPERLEKQIRFMEENPHLSLSAPLHMDLRDGTVTSGGLGCRGDAEGVKALLLVTNPILHPGVIAKKEDLLPYDTALTCTEDLDLWCRMIAAGKKLGIQKEHLLFYRLHGKQITATTKEKQHREVLGIEKTYFQDFNFTLDQGEFYTHSLYFRDQLDPKGLKAFFTKMKRENKTVSPDALRYAMLEIIAEYKRSGAKKKDVLFLLTLFSPLFLIKEGMRRKKSAKADLENLKKTAASLSLVPKGGDENWPIYSYANNVGGTDYAH